MGARQSRHADGSDAARKVEQNAASAAVARRRWVLCGDAYAKYEPSAEAAAEEPPALVFAKTVGAKMGKHKRVNSTDVEYYVRNLFESARSMSSSKRIEQHRSITKATTKMKRSHTLQAVHLDHAPFSTAALQEAAFSGQVDAVSRLVRQGYDVNERYVNFETPLHVAAEGGHALMARELLHHGADLLAIDKDGWTALHHAALQGHVDCVEALLSWVHENDGNPRDQLDAVDEDGLTPLHAAVHLRNYTATTEQVEQLRLVIRLLLKAGANINFADNNGWTAMHLAAQCGHVALVSELLDEGADVTQVDSMGKMPIDYACSARGTQFRSREISRILAEAAAKYTPAARCNPASRPATPRVSETGQLADPTAFTSPMMSPRAASASPARTPQLSPRGSPTPASTNGTPRTPHRSRLGSPNMSFQADPSNPLYWELAAEMQEAQTELEIQVHVDATALDGETGELPIDDTDGDIQDDGSDTERATSDRSVRDLPDADVAPTHVRHIRQPSFQFSAATQEATPMLAAAAAQVAVTGPCHPPLRVSQSSPALHYMQAATTTTAPKEDIILPYKEESPAPSPRLSKRQQQQSGQQQQQPVRETVRKSASYKQRVQMAKGQGGQRAGPAAPSSLMSPTKSSMMKRQTPATVKEAMRRNTENFDSTKKTRSAVHQVVHYTASGICYVYEIEKDTDSVQYGNPMYGCRQSEPPSATTAAATRRRTESPRTAAEAIQG